MKKIPDISLARKQGADIGNDRRELKTTEQLATIKASKKKKSSIFFT